MTLTATEMAALLSDLHIDPNTDSWPDEISSHPIYEVADDEVCSWCDQPVTDDDAVDYCHRIAAQIHTNCHYETGCRCL